MSVRERLLELLIRDSFARGTFRLASGKESDFFIDCKRTVLTAEGHHLVGELLLSEIEALDEPSIVAVAGVALGGCSLASAVSMASYARTHCLDAVYVRKEAKDHGTSKQIEGADKLARGAGVVLVEDAVTTGGSSLRACDVLRGAGFVVQGLVAIVDREEGAATAFAEAGLRFRALYSRRDFGL